MIQLFVVLFLILTPILAGLFFLFKRLYVDDGQDINFGAPVDYAESYQEYVIPAKREHVAYQDQVDGFFVNVIKRFPKTILTVLIIHLGSMLYTGYLSTRYIESLAMAGSAIVQGEYGMAISSLWPIGKDIVVEQTRIARGKHKFLDKNDLTNFSYIGSKKGISYAVMSNPYSTQDRIKDISKENDSYGVIILGRSADEANELCEEDYGSFNGKLLTSEIWDMSRSHMLAAINVGEYPDVPEWLNNRHKEDKDLYYLLSKNTNEAENIQKEKIDNKENGLFVDGDSYKGAGFRCQISWKTIDGNSTKN